MGWELHAGDRASQGGSEPFLHYLPRCLYLCVEGATWVVHPRLGKGVVPLHPVTRTWVLNDATEAHI